MVWAVQRFGKPNPTNSSIVSLPLFLLSSTSFSPRPKSSHCCFSYLAMAEQKEKEPIKEASEEISRQFKTLIDSGDLDSLRQTQHLILGRLQDSNAVLSHFNEYSENCFAEVSGDLTKHTRVLKSMKSDLDYIFQKLRNMKSRILATYPDAFQDDSKGEVLDRRPDLELPQ